MAKHQPLTPQEVQHMSAMVNRALTASGLSLNALAKAAGVSQPMAFGVLHGRIKKLTPNVRRLQLYISIVLGAEESVLERELKEKVLLFIGAGGDVDMLLTIVEALTTALHKERDGGK